MILNYKKNKTNIDKHWIAEIKLYRSLENPVWVINTSKACKLMKMIEKLPVYNEGIPELFDENYSCCILKNTLGLKIICFKRMVIFYENNLIEIKQDSDYTIENEILRLAPDNVYKEACHFI